MSSALALAWMRPALPASPQDATWLASPGSVYYDGDHNWSSGTVPSGTAYFGASTITNLTIPGNDEANTRNVGGWTFNAGAGNYTFANGQILNFSGTGIVINGGSATITSGAMNFYNASTAGGATINDTSLNFYNTSSAGNATIATVGDVNFYNSSTAGSAHITINYNGEDGAWLFFRDSSTAGGATITNNMKLVFNDTSTAGGAAITNIGIVSFSGASTAENATITNNAYGVLGFSGTSTAGNATITNNANGSVGFSGASTAGNATITNNANGSLLFSGTSTGGNAAITNAAGGGLVDFSGSRGPAGDNKLSAGSIAGAGEFFLGARTITVGGNNLSTMVNGVISDCGANGTACYARVLGMSATGGSLVKTGTGTLTLSGINTYTGTTTVDGGILRVDGSIQTSSGVTVNANGALMGTGTVGSTTVNSGGALLGGNGTSGTSLAISGNLAFQSGAYYFVQLNPVTASSVNVSGTATLGGTVRAIFANGSYVEKQYTILTAGSVSGSFASVASTNLTPNLQTTLSYDATHAYLNVVLAFVPPPGSGLTGNQQGAGNAIIDYFNSHGGIPFVYSALTAPALTQASGESATGSQQTTFNAMNQFMGVMTDPFIDGRAGQGAPGSGVTPYADEQASAYAATRSPADAFAAIYRKAAPIQVYDPRWSVWAAAFGGAQATDGNMVQGTNNTTSRLFGTAIGADYRFSPDTVAGFALAGGGTNFYVVNGGSGRSDLFQAGAFVRHTMGAAYLSGALAYGWQDITTDRTVRIAGVDQLRAEFNANAWSGRGEGGYRLIAPWLGGVGLTPYAAAQFTTFQLPAYAEGVVSGANNFALAYGARSVTDTRSELGLRADKSFAMPNAILTLRGRAAWSHDFDPDRAIGATFQALPGASFVVNGARQASDAALTTASAEMKGLNGWSAAAAFEGEFSSVTRSYAGKGTVRYAW